MPTGVIPYFYYVPSAPHFERSVIAVAGCFFINYEIRIEIVSRVHSRHVAIILIQSQFRFITQSLGRNGRQVWITFIIKPALTAWAYSAFGNAGCSCLQLLATATNLPHHKLTSPQTQYQQEQGSKLRIGNPLGSMPLLTGAGE